MRRPVNIFGNPAGSLIFGGFWFVYLFFVGASAIYSLIKSPVPDAASPVHGYSRSMAYARGFYLISLSCLLFLLIFIESNIQEMVPKLEIRNSRDVRKTRVVFKKRFSKVDFQKSRFSSRNFSVPNSQRFLETEPFERAQFVFMNLKLLTIAPSRSR